MNATESAAAATRDRIPAYDVAFTVWELSTARTALAYYIAIKEGEAKACASDGLHVLARIDRAEANRARAALAATNEAMGAEARY